jgi:FK506-binding nuclear protein
MISPPGRIEHKLSKAEEEPKLSKKQLKKLKNNKGEAVEVEKKADKADKTADAKSAKGDKKVQFAKNLEQGPTGPAAADKGAKLGVKVVNGVTLDDRKLGQGRVVKKGNKVGVRYIGKLQDGKVFDCKIAPYHTRPFSLTDCF